MAGYTQEPTQRPINNASKRQCRKQCSASHTKPDHATMRPYRRSSNPTSNHITANQSNQSMQHTTQTCVQEYIHMHPVIRSAVTRHLHSHTVTTTRMHPVIRSAATRHLHSHTVTSTRMHPVITSAVTRYLLTHRDAPACMWSSGAWPPGGCTHMPSN